SAAPARAGAPHSLSNSLFTRQDASMPSPKFPELTPNRRILIVDDNEAIHADFHKILAAGSGPSLLDHARAALFGDEFPSPPTLAGYEIASAYQGQEAMELVRLAEREGRPF